MEQATTATASSSHFELLQSALAAVAEGTVPFSNDRGDTFEVPRYRRNDADAVTRAVLTRSRKLGGYIYQLVRVVRLAALCSPRAYHHFFWSRLAQLGPSYFKNAIQEAKDKNRLPDSMIRVISESKGSEGSHEVIEFLEPAMLAGGKSSPYRLSYGNLPPVVALLEIMNYTLTPAVMDQFFKPLLTPVATATAENIAQELNRKFSEWLKLALGADFANRKAHAIERFLASQSGEKGRRFAVTDQVILDFWLSLNTGGSGPLLEKGLKRFRYAAQAMLRYHRAQQLASADLVEISEDTEYWDSGQWRSPIIDLFSPLCRPVKWFRSKEDQLTDLSNYFDGCDLAKREDSLPSESIASETSIPPSETTFRAATLTMFSKLDQIDAENGSLMGKDRFDSSFLRTLLRVDVFGAVQNKLTKALREGSDRLPLDQIVALLPPETEDGYLLRKHVYSDIRNDLVKTMLASIGQFAQRRPADLDASATTAVLTLINKLCQLNLCPSSMLQFLGGRPAARAEDFDEEEYNKRPDKMDWSDVHRAVGDNLPGAYKRKTGNAAVDEFIVRVKEAGNQRQGFKPTDLADPATQEAHNQAAPALVLLLTELDGLDLSLEKFTVIKADTFIFAEPVIFNVDRQIFADAFAAIYGA